MNLSVQSSKAFTLIELLVVVSLILILTAATIPNYNNYLDNQMLKQAQEAVKNDLRSVQNRALTGTNADTVDYWGIKFFSNTNTYRIISGSGNPNCSTFTNTSGAPSQRLPANTTIGTNGCVFFSTNNGDRIAGVDNISVVSDAGSKVVCINPAGLIYSRDSSGGC